VNKGLNRMSLNSSSTRGSQKSIAGGLTRLFNELDRDRDGYLAASDLVLLGRVILGYTVSASVATSELHRAKEEAEKRLGVAGKAFQKDALSLEEFLACSWFLEDVPEAAFEGTITEYIEAIRRLTGVISQSELIMLKMARDQLRQSSEGKQADLVVTADDAAMESVATDHVADLAKEKSFLRMRSQKSLFARTPE